MIGWGDGQNGLNNERAMVAVANTTEAGDRPNFPSVAVSPDGTDVLVVYNAYLDPWRNDTTSTRRTV